MVTVANKRFEEVRERHPKAKLIGVEDTRVFYLLADEPAKYHEYAQATTIPVGIDRKAALNRIAKSLKELSKEWQLLHKLAS